MNCAFDLSVDQKENVDVLNTSTSKDVLRSDIHSENYSDVSRANENDINSSNGVIHTTESVITPQTHTVIEDFFRNQKRKELINKLRDSYDSTVSSISSTLGANNHEKKNNMITKDKNDLSGFSPTINKALAAADHDISDIDKRIQALQNYLDNAR